MKEKKLKFDKEGIRKAVVLANAGALGNEFWQEVSDRVNQATEPKVTARKLKDSE